MQVTLDHTHDENAEIRTFFFTPERPLHYTAGQFIELTIPHDNPDDRGVRRWFTLSSSPSQDFLTITTRLNPEHGSSFKRALVELQKGDVVTMSDAMGDFVLPKLVQTPLVFIAGGIGITPFHSMLQWLADTGETRPIRLLHAVRTEDDIIFQETFDKAGQHATIVVSEPSEAWGGERGHIDAEMILGLEKPSDDSLIYISGPEPMVESLVDELKNAGVKPSQLVGDYFPNYPAE